MVDSAPRQEFATFKAPKPKKPGSTASGLKLELFGHTLVKTPKPEKPDPDAQGLNLEHPSLVSVSGFANTEEKVLAGFDTKAIDKINAAVNEVFPEEKPLTEKQLNSRAYRVTVVSEKEHIVSDKPEVGFIYLPQAGGTSAGTAQLAAEIYRENLDPQTGYKSLKQRADINVTFAASLSSSVSLDTSYELSSNHVERAAIQAAAIYQIIKENPCQKIVLAGHSLGGMELPYVTAILQQLMVKNGLSTEIGGMIMVESGSMYKQSRWEFITRRLPLFKSGAAEEKFLYPTQFDLGDVQEQIREARKVEQDPDKVMRLQAKYDAMKENYDNHPGLNVEEIIKLKDIDKAIEKAAIGNNALGIGLLQRLRHRTLDSPMKIEFKKRLTFLKPKIGERIQGAEVRTAGTPAKPSIIATMNIFSELEVTKPLAQRIRDQIKGIDVAVVFGDDSPYFKASEAINRMTTEESSRRAKLEQEKLQKRATEELDTLSRFFPHARRYIEATVTNFSHRSPVVSSDKTADILVDIAQRMLKPNSSNLAKEQLFYAVGPAREVATS